MKHRLFLLDAMALLYRSHFAFIRAPRMTNGGLNTSAIFGFTNTVLELINKEDPSHLAVVWDTDAPTFRHEEFKEYKANREAQPEDMKIARPYVHKMMEILKVSEFALDGFEADDLIGTISAQVDPDQYEVYMVTPDKDYAQLVKENVFLYRPNSRGGGFTCLDAEGIVEKFGVRPDQIIDYLGLKGDAVDNLPGVPKIGEKTAVQLLSDYASIEEMIEKVEEISKKSIQKTLKENGEQGLLTKHLATIKTDVDFDWSIDDLKMGHCDLEALMALMHELEFRTTAERILNSKLNPMRPDQQKDLFGQGVGERAQVQVSDVPGGVKTIEDSQAQYHLVQSEAEIDQLLTRLGEAQEFCFDTETTSLNAMDAELVGVSFSLKAKEAYFLFFPAEQTKEEVQKTLQRFAPIFADPQKVKIGQNLKYDLLVLKSYGLAVAEPFFDTMIAHYIVEPEGQHGMDYLAEHLLGYKPVKIEELIGKKGKNQGTMRDVEVEKIVPYACEDADITFQLKEKLAPGVKGNRIFEDIEEPLMPVLADIEFNGVRVDAQVLADYSQELDQRLVKLEKEIYELAGEEFNINSPKQLGEILFDKLGLGKGQKQKKTKTGQYQTNEQVLADLAIQHELPGQVLAYRGIKKLKSTYVDALPELINPHTGRVHTTFRQTVAVTGRLSSEKPNLQNIPIRTDDGREVRKGFIARDSDHLLLSADYSQVELRIMASMSQDENLMAAFKNQEDVHRATAARVFGVEPGEVSSEQRSRAKTVNFGIIYGISAFGLSQRMGIPRSEAAEIIELYFAQYPAVKEYMDACIAKAREQGYVETAFGRRRTLPNINSRNATQRGFDERNAINSPIQGTAADIIKVAMIRIFRAMQEADLKSKMILQVHDELLFDVHRDEVEPLKAIVEREMMAASPLDVPLEVEMGTGNNWLEAH
jgi:DNA polymerase-1